MHSGGARRWFCAWSFGALLASLVGCEQPADRAPAPVPGALHVPDAGVERAVDLASNESCTGCHPAAAEQWRHSAHAFASFDNPIYRVSVDGFRQAQGAANSRMCAGCHDLALLVDGAMDREVLPDDPRALAGVGCMACHAVADATPAGNGSLTFRTRVHVPADLSPPQLRRHRESVDVTSLGSRLCAACHRAFLGTSSGHDRHLPGSDDFGPWLESGMAGPSVLRLASRPQRGCADCHMPQVEGAADLAAPQGVLRSHRFAAGHSWLAAMTQDREGLRRARQMLRGAVELHVVPLVEADAPSGPSAGRAFDVLIHNRGAGHRFPAGVRDAQQSWLEVAVLDATGAEWLGHGRDPGRDAHVLAAWAADAQGRLQRAREAHNFRAVLADHTVPAGGSRVARYESETAWPEGARVRVRLLHQSRNTALQAKACAASRDARGRAFARAARRHDKPSLDPCAPMPVTVVAETQLDLDAPDVSARAWLLHARSLIDHEVQQGLTWAESSLDHARSAWESDNAAPLWFARGLLAIRWGQTRRARHALSEARARFGDHPAFDHAEASALERSFRPREARPLRRAVAAAAPQSVAAWTALAVNELANDSAAAALDAAEHGLRLSPHDPELLRLRALASDNQQHWMQQAEHTLTEAAPLRTACARIDPGCAVRLRPVPVYRLRAAAR